MRHFRLFLNNVCFYICILELSILFSCRLFVQPFEKQKRRSCCQPPSRKRIRSQCQSRIQQSICQPRFLQTHRTYRNHLVRIWTFGIWPNWTCCLEIFRRFWQKETKVNRTLFPPKWLFLALKYNYSYSNDVFCLQSHYFIINVRKFSTVFMMEYRVVFGLFNRTLNWGEIT